MNKGKIEWRTSTGEVLRMVAGVRRSFLPLLVLERMIASAILFLNIIVGAMVLDGVADAVRQADGGMLAGGAVEAVEHRLVRLALFLVLLNMVLALCRWGLNKWLIVLRREVNDVVMKKISEKCLTLDYQILERKGTLDYIETASNGERMTVGVVGYCQNLGDACGNITAMIYSAVLLVRFLMSRGNGAQDGLAAFADSSRAGLLMVVLMGAAVAIRFLITKKRQQWEYQVYENSMRNSRHFEAYFMFLWEYRHGKQVRIYDMAKMIGRSMAREVDSMMKTIYKRLWRQEGMSVLTEVVMGSLMLVCYGFVGIKAVSGAITIGELSLYVGALTSFTSNVSEFFVLFNWLQVMNNQYMGCLLSLLALENEKYEGTIPIEKRLDNDYELEFKNVSFHYPNNEEMVLEHITAKIHVGRKMAIVGKNGSGKSTFIKLLCRLYDPTEGEILLNGIDIRKYDYDEYRRIFGVVFQDFQLFSFSIAQNVAASVAYDEKRVWRALRQAGLKERVKEMEEGIGTVIYKQDGEGVEISGGEAQKLAIARALYRDAPVVILDEPTAALDPVSELEIYGRFDEMVEHKTAIYISHRMSSCRFCENILVFDQGDIIQMGNHDTLVGSDGLYRDLWEAQAQYYQG